MHMQPSSMNSHHKILIYKIYTLNFGVTKILLIIDIALLLPISCKYVNINIPCSKILIDLSICLHSYFIESFNPAYSEIIYYVFEKKILNIVANCSAWN